MAKLKGPLFSLGASGAIGKVAVYFGWKGLNCVREYVVPANPKTPKQITQRSYVTDAVAKIHAAEIAVAIKLKTEDKAAYALKGSTHPTPRTWFNEIVKNWIDCKIKVKLACIFCSGEMDNTSKNDFRPHIYFAEEGPGNIAAGAFFLGTSKTAIIATKAGNITAGEGANLLPAGGFSGLTAGRKYYWWFKPDVGDAYEWAASGIYYATTT